MSPKLVRRLIAVVGIVGALNFGWNFAAPLVEVTWEAYDSASWPRTEGTISRSEIETNRGGRESAYVEYTYAVDGRTYTGWRIQRMRSAFDDETARDLVARYPLGPVSVYYKPNDPEKSALVPGLHSVIPLAMLGVGAFVMLAALTSLGRVLLGRRQAPRAP